MTAEAAKVKHSHSHCLTSLNGFSEACMTSAEIDSLFAQTLHGDFDGDEPWEAIRKLRANGSREIFDRAAAWCESDDALKRARAADILCQL
ncbi:MAG TPA: hypothetical protein VHY56_07095, partial [Candidatus Binataceae bacterium]|nr:hypothetical protein [Candidatus Binataceae bacterium]